MVSLKEADVTGCLDGCKDKAIALGDTIKGTRCIFSLQPHILTTTIKSAYTTHPSLPSSFSIAINTW